MRRAWVARQRLDDDLAQAAVEILALGLIAEIGDFARFSHPRELCAWLGIVPCEYSSGEQRHRGHVTKTGNGHARRLLIDDAWAYRHRRDVLGSAARTVKRP
jgi:transposase